MKRLISCEYSSDNSCVELKFTDKCMIAIDTIVVENGLFVICTNGQNLTI